MYGNNKKISKKEQQYWEAERQAAYRHANYRQNHDYRMAIMESQIEQERAKTRQLGRERLQRAEEQKALKLSKNNLYGVTPTKPCNNADVTSFPSSSFSSKPINCSSTSSNSYSNNNTGYDAFKQQPRSVSNPPPQHILKNSETQTIFPSDPTPSHYFKEMPIERKPKPIKFAPRLQPPSLSNYRTSEPKVPNNVAIYNVSETDTKHFDSQFQKYEERYELMKRQQREEANERRRKEEEEFKALKMAIQYEPIKLPEKTHKEKLYHFHSAQSSSSPRRNSVPSMYHQQMVLDTKLKLIENVKVVEAGIGVIGLPKSGRSFLIGALTGGIWPKNLTAENPVITKNGKAIYKLNHPNNGFINGSIDENQPIYDQFFQSSNLPNLSLLILTIDGSVREEDYLILCLAKQYQIPTVIVRTKLDEWLDNLPKGQSKDGYVKADKEFVINSLKDLNMPFSKNHIFNISALAMIQISEEGVTSNMTIYKQDELALLAHLNEHGFGDQRKPDLINADIVILGIKGAGKSTIAESLRHCLNLSKREKFIYEIEYSEMMDVDEILAKIDISKSPIYLFVIPNTVGKMDAELSKYLINFNKNVCVVLNKSDEMIDNLKKQQNFYGNDDYVQKRHEAAQTEFVKVGINPKNFPCFSVSAFVLSGFLDNTYVTQEQAFLNYLRHVLCRIV